MKKPGKPSTATLDLTNVSEADLLKSWAEILSQPGPVTPQQRQELYAIDQEFTRRDQLTLYPKHRGVRVAS